MNTFNLQLLQKFCKTHNTSYLDDMNPLFLQYLYDFIKVNSLQNQKIGKIIKKYVDKKTKLDLQQIETTSNISSNILPSVLVTVLKSMLNTSKHTKQQKIIYKQILQYIEEQKIMQSYILKFGGGYSDSKELTASLG